MNNKTTWTLAACVVIVFAVIGIGFASRQPSPTPPAPSSSPAPEKILSRDELDAQLVTEKPHIDAAMVEAFPSIYNLYVIDREKLYHAGEWYGAVMQYIGDDSNNRDSVRVVLQKKNGAWIVRTTPPALLVSRQSIADAPVSMLHDINRPATLPGTESSPAITPGE